MTFHFHPLLRLFFFTSKLKVRINIYLSYPFKINLKVFKQLIQYILHLLHNIICFNCVSVL
jgi:hypothetical protein